MNKWTWILVGVFVVLAWTIQSCEISGAAQVSWTAPGDDCAVGRAAGYELFASTDSAYTRAVKGTDVQGGRCADSLKGIPRTRIDSLVRRPGAVASWFTTIAQQLPTPSIAGTAEVVTLSLDSGTWYGIVRATDEAGNISGWSNIATFQVDEISPAAIIDLRSFP